MQARFFINFVWLCLFFKHKKVEKFLFVGIFWQYNDEKRKRGRQKKGRGDKSGRRRGKEQEINGWCGKKEERKNEETIKG